MQRYRILLLAGVLGPALFITVWLIEGAGRPGYSPMRNWISELALTDRGWIQITSFISTGLLLVAFAVGLRRAYPDRAASVWGPRLIWTAGLALVAAGLFVIDPGQSYPPGAPAQRTWHGTLHDIAGPVFFLAAAAACFVYARRSAKAYNVLSGVLGILMFAAAGAASVMDYAGVWSPAPAGLLQRIAVVVVLAPMVVLAWGAVADRRERQRPGSGQAIAR